MALGLSWTGAVGGATDDGPPSGGFVEYGAEPAATDEAGVIDTFGCVPSDPVVISALATGVFTASLGGTKDPMPAIEVEG